jgi:calcium-dependent protein kinase
LNESPSSSGRSSPKKSTKDKNKKVQLNIPAEMESSAVTLGDAKINGRRDLQSHPVMITDSISDVRSKYHIESKEIGHGHYGVVRKCMDRETREWYAIKSIRKSKVGKVDVLRREVALLRECDHPNIIKLVEVHEDQKYLHLITELCTGGELFDRIIEKTQSDEGHFSERDAAGLVRCILDAISYCHDKAIVHRDLKPENFLFSSKDERTAVIKIIDFGLSRHDHDVKQGIMNTKVGTPYYVAPEVLNREYTKSCDIWSIGVITYILLCGYPPFYGDTDTQIFESVRMAKFDFPSPDWDGISDSAKEFICSLLQRTPSKRLTARQALNHTWIRKTTGEMQRKSSIAFAPLSIAFIKFRDMQKLKKAALAFLATNATNDDIAALNDVFATIDVTKKGTITLQELDDCLKNSNCECPDP